MFQRLYEFSRCLPDKPDWERLNEGLPANYDRGIAICFDDRGDWCGIEVRYGNQGVVYRSGPPNGTDLTPCNKLAGSTAQRFLKGIEALAAYSGLSGTQQLWLAAVAESYRRHLAVIWEGVELKRKEAGINDKEHRGYVFLARGHLSDPVYSWPEAKSFLVGQFIEPLKKGGVRTGTCSVCAQPAKTVYGNYPVIACYNLDKPGSIAGGFVEEKAHRNLPVCGDCALALAEAFSFAERHFTSFMAGQTYMVLPYAESEAIQKELAYRLGKDPTRFDLDKAHDLVANDLALLREFESEGDQLALSLIFFSAEQASWRIRAEAQHLLPSRMRRLHQAARDLATAADLQTVTKDEEKPLQISAATFRAFAGYGDVESADTLRTWLTALFSEQALDGRHFLHLLIGKLIATEKSNPSLLAWMTRQAWGLYRYALLTGLIQPPHQTIEKTLMHEAIPNSPYGRYVAEHSAFFRRPELVVAFLTGCYASQVAYAQREARNADPFTKKFIGRLLNSKALKNLYREGHGKLAQYDKLGYVITGLDPDLAQAWVACGDTWGIDEDEATFAFTIGYSLAYRINQLYRDKETDQ